jgi:diguanylate cyclase
MPIQPSDTHPMPAQAKPSDSNLKDTSTQTLQAIIIGTEPALRSTVAALVERHADVLARRFYEVMMEYPGAADFLNHQIVEAKLQKSMQFWLNELFSAWDTDKLSTLIARQLNVGEIHARIKLPLHLVTHGARHFKHWIWEYLIEAESLPQNDRINAVIYVNDLIDLAIEVMSSAFVSNADRSARSEEAYRLHTLSQDLAVDRERQRASLLEWAQQVMFALHRQPGGSIARLGNSEFGMWLTHKAMFMFEGANEVSQIQSISDRLDSQIIPQLNGQLDREQVSPLLLELEDGVSQIKFMLTTLFDRYLEVEKGRDVLTRLLNRQFLSTVMAREIYLAKRNNRKFAVLMIDIDHFKKVNDQYGHDAGDAALQQISSLILNSVRAGDFVFRYGGEEILVLLVDIDLARAESAAELIRSRIERTTLLLSLGRTLQLTVSIGTALFDGHPDYRFLITRADSALYKAKNAGRNRCISD